MNNQSETTSVDHNQNSNLVTISPSKKFTKGQIVSFATLVVMLMVLPVTASIALVTTRLNSRAYLPATPPTPPVTITVSPTTIPTSTPSTTPTPTTTCKNSVKTLKNLTPCSNKTTNGYKAVVITCQNNYSETFNFKTCTNRADIQNIANSLCQKKAICSTNRPPKVITEKLNNATLNKPYTTTIEAQDPDIKDTIKITATNLPSGLVLDENCSSPKAFTRTTCKIVGSVKKNTESKKIEIKATDSHGASSTKILELIVISNKR